MDLMQRKITIIFLSTIIVRVIFHWLTNFTFDDAFITFRYVENLVVGNGFVYNKGEAVLGTTTPLFTLVLSVVRVIGFQVEQAAMLVSLLASGVTAVVLYKFASSLRMNHFAFLPVLLYIFYPRLLVTDTAGMETSFFTMFVLASLYYLHKEKNYYAWGMATLATVTRPEGPLLLVLFFVQTIVKNKDEIFKLLIIPATILLPWLIFSKIYFGSVIPNSVTAKLALYSHINSESVIDKLSVILNLYNYYGFGMIVLAGIGAYWLWKKQNYGIIAIVWFLGMILPLAISRTALFIWYVSPIYPIYLLFISSGVIFLIEKIKSYQLKIVPIRITIIILVLVSLIPLGYMKVSYYKSSQEMLNQVHKQIGYYLYTHMDDKEIAAVEDIGYIGYLSRKKILDRDGLVSPFVVAYNRSGKYFQLIQDFKPEWVVLDIHSPISQFYKSADFLQYYQQMETFSYDNIQYNCYKKIII